MPQIRFRDAGNVLRTATRIRIRDAGNVLRTVQRIRIRDAGNVLRTVYQYLSTTLSSDTAYGSNSGAASVGSVTSASVTVTPAGGTTPYTYQWNRTSGDLAIKADTATAATTTFSASSVSDSISATFTCKVTDANGAVVTSDPVMVQLNWFDTR